MANILLDCMSTLINHACLVRIFLGGVCKGDVAVVQMTFGLMLYHSYNLSRGQAQKLIFFVPGKY